MKRGVVISGMGMLSSAGANLDEARTKFIAGTCCLSPITDPHTAHLRAKYAGLLPASWQQDADGNFDKHVHIAIVAVREALAAARVNPANWGRRMGLVFSTCSGPMLLIESHYERIVRGDGKLTEEELFAKRYHSGARVLAHALGVQGFSTTIVTACSASTAAIAVAADLIRCGMLDAALAGGSDAFATSTLAGFDGLKATSDGKCAPFSKPFGLNLGEAAAFVFLETAESAQRRSVNVRAEVLGSGTSNDAFHCSSPEPGGRGLAAAMKRALQDAGLPPEQIAYINAHGTGTEANDKAECKAVRKVFGELAAQVPISSTKSMVGHCLGAAGAVEAIASIVCAEAGVLPPTANFTEPREGCGVDCVSVAGRAWSGERVFLSNNSAFGGHNASVVLRVPLGGATFLSPQTSGGGDKNVAAPKEPICLTACGVVSSLGLGAETLAGEQSGLRSVSLPELPPILAGMVDEQAAERFDRRLDLRNMDRSSRWATLATRLAIREAGFSEKPTALAELGLFLNLSAGPSWAESEYLTSFFSNNRQVAQLTAFPYIVPSSVAGNVCRALMLAGANLTLNGGPGAGLLGLGPALAALRAGHTEALLHGAVDELSERILADSSSAGLLSREGACPPGEGAAVVMLETARHAKARGAKPVAQVCGAAFGTEVASSRLPDPDALSLEAVVSEALEQAGIGPGEVSVVCASTARARLAGLAARFCPAWMERVFSVAPRTGSLEGAQPLVDVAAALRQGSVAAGQFILAVASSPHGVNGAVVFKKIDNFA